MGPLGLKWLERIPQDVYRDFPVELKDKMMKYLKENGSPQHLLEHFN